MVDADKQKILDVLTIRPRAKASFRLHDSNSALFFDLFSRFTNGYNTEDRTFGAAAWQLQGTGKEVSGSDPLKILPSLSTSPASSLALSGESQVKSTLKGQRKKSIQNGPLLQQNDKRAVSNNKNGRTKYKTPDWYSKFPGLARVISGQAFAPNNSRFKSPRHSPGSPELSIDRQATSTHHVRPMSDDVKRPENMFRPNIDRVSSIDQVRFDSTIGNETSRAKERVLQRRAAHNTFSGTRVNHSVETPAKYIAGTLFGANLDEAWPVAQLKPIRQRLAAAEDRVNQDKVLPDDTSPGKSKMNGNLAQGIKNRNNHGRQINDITGDFSRLGGKKGHGGENAAERDFVNKPAALRDTTHDRSSAAFPNMRSLVEAGRPISFESGPQLVIAENRFVELNDLLREKLQEVQKKIQLQVKLQIQELGRLDITIKKGGDNINISIQTSTLKAKEVLEKILPQLQESLSQDHSSIDIEVSWDQGGQNNFDYNPSYQEKTWQQQGNHRPESMDIEAKRSERSVYWSNYEVIA